MRQNKAEIKLRRDLQKAINDNKSIDEVYLIARQYGIDKVEQQRIIAITEYNRILKINGVKSPDAKTVLFENFLKYPWF